MSLAYELTPRQELIVLALAEGATPKQIAAAVGINLKQVRRDLTRAREAVGAETTHQLVAIVVRIAEAQRP